MTGAAAVTCPGCGAEASGNFCSDCGARLGQAAGCAECGARLKPNALFCGECGHAVGSRARKPASSHLPWILSGLALAAFSVVIALLVQGQAAPRGADGIMTGGIPGQSGGSQPSSSMPTMEELAAMTPRQRADRLFERAMREHGGPAAGQAPQFINMALMAYADVSPADMDADAHFHVGLLQLVRGDAASARASAEAILGQDPDHLLALILRARVSDFEGDEEDAAATRDRVRSLVEAAGGIPERVEYQSHRPFIESALAEGAQE